MIFSTGEQPLGILIQYRKGKAGEDTQIKAVHMQTTNIKHDHIMQLPAKVFFANLSTPRGQQPS